MVCAKSSDMQSCEHVWCSAAYQVNSAAPRQVRRRAHPRLEPDRADGSRRVDAGGESARNVEKRKVSSGDPGEV